MGRSAKAQDPIAFPSRRKQTAQFAHHSNKRDEPRCQCYIEKSGRNENEKGSERCSQLALARKDTPAQNDNAIRKLMLGKMQRSEYTNGRNAEIRAWVEEHPEVKERIEARIRNVPPQNRERAFINAAKSEAMNQTVRRNGNGIRA